MSSKREEQKIVENEKRAIDRTIEETRDNTSRVIREVRRELPENTATFHDFQEENINAVREMTNTFLDSQKEIAKSLQSTYRPLTSNIFTSMMFWPYYAMNPQTWAENYVKAATQFADTTVAAVRMQNDVLVEGIASTRAFTDYLRKNTKELAKLNVETAKSLERASKEYS